MGKLISKYYPIRFFTLFIIILPKIKSDLESENIKKNRVVVQRLRFRIILEKY
jgi:hypothetical protein